jgi:diguanylate cyclase (GGDEF)-like protein
VGFGDQPGARRKEAMQPITVLLIEDDPEDADLLQEMLLERNTDWCEVEWVDHLQAGLERLAAGRADLVLLDLSLPDGHGLETFAQVHAQATGVPIVVLSGLDDEKLAVQMVQEGAQDYLVKGQADSHLLVRAMRYAIERKTAAEQLRQAAAQDTLTGLPNRALFTERLEHSIQRSKEHRNYLFAVLFLDLDRFKVINDSQGHMIGDQLLVAIARRLEACVRSTDIVARFGGDEFAILLDDIQGLDHATRVADRIQKGLALPVNLKGQKVFTTASIGIALSGMGYDQPADFLRNADTAMYRAKMLGKARYEIFDSSMHTQAVARWRLEADLRQAIERREFCVHYQPLVSLAGGQIVGVEALLRWRHSQRGLLSPAEFIPLAEETGLIWPIGEWALRTACAQAMAWQMAGRPHLRVAVNVSPHQLALQTPAGQGPNLSQLVKEVLDKTGLAPHSLEIEITESVAISEDGSTILNELSAMGVQISLDDFGLGSSLACLRNFPLNTVKIDQSFVSGMVCDASDETIIMAIIAMAHGLNLKVIAEGVETREQLDFLRSKQCDEIQGNLFSQPLSAGVLSRLLLEERCLPS